MQYSPTYFPQATDEPLGRMGGPVGDIPLLDLEGSGPGVFRPNPVHLHFQADDDAVRYLTALAAEATALVQQIREHQTASAVA